jgi:guanylate kinase
MEAIRPITRVETAAVRPEHPGLVVALIAGSTGGKSWLAKQLTAAGVVAPVPSVTDRPPRTDEVDTSFDHTFVDGRTFDAISRRGEFVIQASLYGHRYGLPPIPAPAEPGLPSLVLLKDPVVEPFREIYPCSTVYHLESSDGHEKLEEIMTLRGQAVSDIIARQQTYQEELENGRRLADKVFVSPGHPQNILGDIQQAIAMEQAVHDITCEMMI